MSSAAHHRRSGARRLPRAVTALVLGIGALAFGLGTPAAVGAVAANARDAWNFQQIHVSRSVQQAGRDGRGVIVAVVDTWVDGSNQAEFGGRVLAGADCANRNGHCVPGQAHDDCGHGTHVAGTVASTNWGVAPAATILPVRVLTDPDGKHADECTGSTEDVAAGITWARQHGARVINLSLAAVKGVATASPVTAAVRQATDAGVVVVFAAGNSDRPVADSYDGRALIVAATGPSGGLASYSQHGLGVSVAAPGGDPRGPSCSSNGSDCVVSTWLHDEYAALAGTSMSAPHVSGLAALLIGQQPTRSQRNVVQMIKSTAHPLSGAGSGRIDAAAAMGVSASTPVARKPSAAEPAPTHRAKAQSVPGNRQAATLRPVPTPPSVRPSAAAAPAGGLRAVTAKHAGANSDLPLAPPLISALLLFGLASGLLAVGRRARTGGA